MATAIDVPVVAPTEPDAPFAVPAPDPLVLGLPLIAIGALALGLQLIGFVPSTSNGSPLALLLGGSGIGLVLATLWAARLERTPSSSPWSTGVSLPATVLGSLAAFFLSYAGLVLGLTHGWYGVAAPDVQDTVALFQISWAAGFGLLAAASLRLPLIFTVLYGALAAVLALLAIGTLGESTAFVNLGGVLTLVVAAAVGYVFLAVASSSSGGREHPLGDPVRR